MEATTSVAAPGDTDPSDATDSELTLLDFRRLLKTDLLRTAALMVVAFKPP